MFLAASRRTASLRLATLACLLALAAGCATLSVKLEAPRVTVNSMAFGGGDMAQQQIVLNLHVENPNSQRIAIRGIDCNLEVAGTPFAHGQTEAAVTLPALGSTDFNVDVTADMNAALLALAGGLRNRQLDYRLYGVVRLQRGLLRNVPFDQTGKLRL